jgi:hypothetical protein
MYLVLTEDQSRINAERKRDRLTLKRRLRCDGCGLTVFILPSEYDGYNWKEWAGFDLCEDCQTKGAYRNDE